MFKKRRKKKKWGQRLGYGCMTCVAIGIVALFTFSALVNQRTLELHEKFGEPTFLKHQAERLAESTNPQDESPSTETVSNHPRTTDQAEKAQAAMDEFAASWEKIRSSLSGDAWRIEHYFAYIEQLGKNEATWEKLYSVLSEFPELVELSKVVVNSGMPPCLELNPDIGFGAQNFGKGRRIEICGSVLAIDARMKAESGDPAGAGESLLDLLRLADTFSVLPHWTGYNIRVNSQKAVLNVLASMDFGTAVTPEQTQEIIDRLGARHYRQQAIDKIEYSVYSNLEIVEEMGYLSTHEFVQRYSPVDQDDYGAQIIIGIMGSPILNPFLLNNANNMFDAWEQLRQVADLPYPEARPVLRDMMEEFNNSNLQGVGLLSMRNLNDIFREQCELESAIEYRRLRLAIELYHVEHNIYPMWLSDVADLLGGEVPVDPWTGGAYMYTPSAEGFELRSGI